MFYHMHFVLTYMDLLKQFQDKIITEMQRKKRYEKIVIMTSQKVENGEDYERKKVRGHIERIRAR